VIDPAPQGSRLRASVSAQQVAGAALS
jgi:hypothetical protein